jgi:phage-related holin
MRNPQQQFEHSIKILLIAFVIIVSATLLITSCAKQSAIKSIQSRLAFPGISSITYNYDSSKITVKAVQLYDGHNSYPNATIIFYPNRKSFKVDVLGTSSYLTIDGGRTQLNGSVTYCPPNCGWYASN